MPIKKTSTNSKTSFAKELAEKKTDSKKVVVKKRTSDLAPTKASAAAIASQAQRARKQALVQKMSAEWKKSENINQNKKSTKIPLRVWIFFGCALLFFSIAFYKAILSPQLDVVTEWTNVKEDSSDYYRTDGQNLVDLWEINNIDEFQNYNDNTVDIINDWEDMIYAFMNRLSNQNFDWLFQLFDGPLQRSQEMKDHFTAFRISPFLAWIQWNKLSPTNIQYVGKTANWNDEYKFDLSYELISTNDQYDETWKVIVKEVDGDLRIASIMCETKKCSYHPLFWPENFGLMR